jgi:hypothetical protein
MNILSSLVVPNKDLDPIASPPRSVALAASAVIGDGIEWDQNSKCCVLCLTVWGTFTNRRHHCRHCRRLVCESCSSKRLVLPGQDPNEPAKRVCDDCNVMLTTKQLFKQEISIQRGRQEHVLKSASFVSVRSMLITKHNNSRSCPSA